MKIILSILFVFIFAFAAFGQSQCPVTLSTYSIGFSGATFPQEGRGTVVEVFAPAGCNWTATSNQGWTVFNPSSYQTTASGTGNSAITVYAIGNDRDPRTGSITVNDKTISVSQGASCFYHFRNADETQLFPADGGMHPYTNILGTNTGICTITYTTDDSWIHLAASSFSVDKNDGALRTGRIIYHYGSQNTLTLYVRQEAGTPAPTPTPSPTPTCTFALGTTSQTFTYTGGSGLIDVITQNGCAYTATNNDSFVTLSKSNGAGNGTINFDVAANPGGATRTSTITVQGQIFTVTQSGGKTRKRVRFF